MMAIYRVQGPDGAIHKFEGPDDATPAQVEAAAAQQFGGQQPKKSQPEKKGYIEDTFDTAKEGFKFGGIPGVMGALAWKGVSKDIPAIGQWAGDKIIDATEGSGLSPNIRAGLATAGDMGVQFGATSGPVMKAIGKAPGVVQGVSRRLMTSALKPSVTAHESGNAARAIDTLLEQGVSVTPGGVDKLRSMLDTTNKQIAEAVSGSNATVSKSSVAQRLKELFPRMQNQVNPQGDIAAIQKAGEQFMEHPLLPTDEIPIALAQKLKQGTYSQLAGKYGEEGSAAIESQKALARGLKEEIANQIPELFQLNKIDSDLYNAISLTERRVLMEANKNPLSLAALASNQKAAAAYMADKSPAFKSIVARMLNAISKPIGTTKKAVLPPTMQNANQFKTFIDNGPN